MPRIEAIASVVGRRIDAIRLTHERYARELREQEIGKLATEAELRALRAQINPHFLFNALTTIGYLIQTAPPRALETLMQLTALLRSVLRSEGEFTTLGRELELIESYLDIEHARFEQRLRVRIDVPAALRSLRVPPLLLQPIVENAVKHGIAPLTAWRRVTVTAWLDDGRRRRARSSSRYMTPAPVSACWTCRPAAPAASDCATSSGGWPVSMAMRPRCRLTATPDAGTTVEIRMPAEYRGRRALRIQAERVVNARLRVVIADDERPARSFLAALLRSFEDVVMVAEAASGTRGRGGDRKGAPGSGAAGPADAGARWHRRRAHAEEAPAAVDCVRDRLR